LAAAAAALKAAISASYFSRISTAFPAVTDVSVACLSAFSFLTIMFFSTVGL
jgi:hypothetical protein